MILPLAEGDAVNAADTVAAMDISEWWPKLPDSTRAWLIEHNGESLPDDVVRDVMAVNAHRTDPLWWAGESQDGQSQLTDQAIDWIESAANDEAEPS
jgi:hypothetical protein